MRNDSINISFSAVADGGTVADVDVSDADQVAVVVDIDSIAGAFGTATFYVVPLADQALGRETVAGEHIRKSAGANAAGTWICGLRDTAIMEPAFENVYKKIRIIADLAGGVTSVTGSVYVLPKRW